MSSRKSYKESKKEFEDKYYEKIVRPLEKAQEVLEEKFEQALEDPISAMKDPIIIELLGLGKNLERIKKKLELSMRNLLLAHAGGAILTINLLPNVMGNKELLSIATNALSDFAWGLVLLLLSVCCIFISDWSNLFQNYLKTGGIRNWPILDYDFSSPSLFVAATCGLISLYLFVSAILMTANSIGELI